jgi:hypothetical protein
MEVVYFFRHHGGRHPSPRVYPKHFRVPGSPSPRGSRMRLLRREETPGTTVSRPVGSLGRAPRRQMDPYFVKPRPAAGRVHQMAPGPPRPPSPWPAPGDVPRRAWT